MSLLGQGDREAEIEIEILKYTLLFGTTKVKTDEIRFIKSQERQRGTDKE